MILSDEQLQEIKTKLQEQCGIPSHVDFNSESDLVSILSAIDWLLPTCATLIVELERVRNEVRVSDSG